MWLEVKLECQNHYAQDHHYEDLQERILTEDQESNGENDPPAQKDYDVQHWNPSSLDVDLLIKRPKLSYKQQM